MPIPEFIVEIRKMIGQHEMWLPGVTAVVTRGSADHLEVLLVRRADNGQWTPITGIPEIGEEPGPAAAREALEETGVVVSVDRLASTSVHPGIVHANGDRASYLDLTFACTYVSGEAHVADDESIDVRWFRRDALPEMSALMAKRIDDALSGEQAARFLR
jgi:8-oxo-dGTP pyrophosphatase MutT (NUDIX family)